MTLSILSIEGFCLLFPLHLAPSLMASGFPCPPICSQITRTKKQRQRRLRQGKSITPSQAAVRANQQGPLVRILGLFCATTSGPQVISLRLGAPERASATEVRDNVTATGDQHMPCTPPQWFYTQLALCFFSCKALHSKL